jgi:hypothetical protein
VSSDAPLTSSTHNCRPTGWHGESGRANWGGHITVDFRTRAHVHVSTHHVYRTEAAYGGKFIKLYGNVY